MRDVLLAVRTCDLRVRAFVRARVGSRGEGVFALQRMRGKNLVSSTEMKFTHAPKMTACPLARASRNRLLPARQRTLSRSSACRHGGATYASGGRDPDAHACCHTRARHRCMLTR